MVDEEARQVGTQDTLSETEIEILNQKLSLIADVIEDGYKPEVTITYFVPDARKMAANTAPSQRRRGGSTS